MLSTVRGRAIAVLAPLVMAAACAPAAPDDKIFSLTWGKLGIGYESFVGQFPHLFDYDPCAL